ncbi:MAG: hypothetical protein ACI80N_004012 [Gammaproteobacteria bacterium]|jgi:hypothetical protein
MKIATKIKSHRIPTVGLALVAVAWTSCVMPLDQLAPATPQRPTFSTDTRMTAAHTVEVESGLNVDPGDSVTLPVRGKIGLDHSSEAYVEWSPLQWINTPGSDEVGIGDLRFGYRNRFRDATEDKAALAYHLEAKIPTADAERGQGSGETDLFAGIAGEKQVQQLRLNAFYQLGLLGEVDNGTVDVQHALAMVATRSLDRGLEAFGEGTYLWTPEQDDEQLFATLGVTYARTPALIFDASIRFGITPDAPDFIVLVGLTQNYGQRQGRSRPAQ